MNTKVLCSHCGITKIDKKYYEANGGQCGYCKRTQTLCEKQGIPYVKFVDKDDTEKLEGLKRRYYATSDSKKKKLISNRIAKLKENIKVSSENVSQEPKKHSSRAHYTYDDEFIDLLKEKGPHYTVKELLEICHKLRPQYENLRLQNLYYLLDKYNINYKKGTNYSDGVKKQESITEQQLNVDEDSYQNSETHNIKPVNNSSNRLEPITQEVKNVLKKKYRDLECDIEVEYTVQDYINMFEMLLYLKDNQQDLVRKRADQYDIMNTYQNEIVHEMENIISEKGDTYLQDKMHVLRNIRRDTSTDRSSLTKMYYFLHNIDRGNLCILINNLKDCSELRENSIFIPQVDTTMVEKYDWAKNGTINSKKANSTILTTNAQSAINKKNAKTYRVSCQLSGGKYGTFTNWYKDFKAIDEKQALAHCKNFLNQTLSKDVLVSNMKAHLINN